ncbi:MAG: LL-diaminopimelate aminotransferase [Oscillospiraceae bacterium]|nr:LL-diaminopimelate aminotransferase [Oscillospiraceae bacterium]
MINNNFSLIPESYLFSEISKRVAAFSARDPSRNVIRLGIGDVTLPLPLTVVSAMKKACDEMADAKTFRGYGPEQGYGFLREAITRYYTNFSVELNPNEIFISDGAKSDLGNMLDIFAPGSITLIPNPVYPTYFDTNTMSGNRILFADGNESNGFLPSPPSSVTEKPDLIYICSPNNPTGSAYTRETLSKWIDFAISYGSVIIFDAAYESFITEPGIPHSIFELPRARECAIEVCSLSKTAGFTGTRCGYTVIPDSLVRNNIKLSKLWLRRQTTKFNGVPYIIQRGAEAVFTPEGLSESRRNIEYYHENARIIISALSDFESSSHSGIKLFGGVNAPYIFMKCPNGLKSWEFFDLLLEKSALVGTPGAGFGSNGEGYFRLTAFGSRENVIEAAERIRNLSL